MELLANSKESPRARKDRVRHKEQSLLRLTSYFNQPAARALARKCACPQAPSWLLSGPGGSLWSCPGEVQVAILFVSVIADPSGDVCYVHIIDENRCCGISQPSLFPRNNVAHSAAFPAPAAAATPPALVGWTAPPLRQCEGSSLLHWGAGQLVGAVVRNPNPGTGIALTLCPSWPQYCSLLRARACRKRLGGLCRLGKVRLHSCIRRTRAAKPKP